MKPERLRTAVVGLALACGVVCGFCSPVALASAPGLMVFGEAHGGADPTLHRLGGSLRELAARVAIQDRTRLRAVNPALHLRVAAPLTEPEILIDAVADGDAAQLAQRLEALGMRETAVYGNSVGGWLPVSALAEAGRVPGLRLARASMPRRRGTGPVALQGDFAQYSAALRSANPSLTGAGITVGVLSDSFNCYAYYAANGPAASTVTGVYGYATNGFTATYADDEASGALPSGVTVVKEASCADYGAPQQMPFSDEGRAMLQIVHVVAPGASLAFRTAVSSEADFANGIIQLQQLGARVIADDIGYPDEPFFQDGEIAQAIDEVAGEGVAYFSAAGNDGRNSWESSSPVFATDVGAGTQNVDFAGGGGSLTLPVTIPAIPPGDYVALVLEWDQPYVTGASGSPGSSNQLNLCIDSAAPQSDLIEGNETSGSSNGQFESVSYPACTGPNDIGGDPVQILLVGNPADASGNTQAQTINISIRLVSGTAPGRVKLLVGDNGLGATIDSTLATQSPTIQGHPMATGAVAMAAAFYMDTPACGTSAAELESYSSWGGDPILFDTSGNRLSSPEIRSKPDLTGPDGVNNTMLGFVWSGASQTATVSSCQSNASYPNFFGTSAATPHAAAAAALLWQFQSSASASQVIDALKSGAVSMGSDQADGSGAGFIQAQTALADMPSASSSGSSTSTSTSTSTSNSTASHHGGGGAFDGLLLALLGAVYAFTIWRSRPCDARWRG